MKIIRKHYIRNGKRYHHDIAYVRNDKGIWRRFAITNYNGTVRRFYPQINT